MSKLSGKLDGAAEEIEYLQKQLVASDKQLKEEAMVRLW